MKKITSLMAMLLMAVASMALISCADEDDEIAMTLEGTWQGDMDVYYEYGGHNYEALWSEICFEGDPFRWSSGTGYWMDYYKDSPWGRDYVAYHIRWNVSNEVIYVRFVEDGYEIAIHDYRLSNSRFAGTIWDGDKRVNFKLLHVDSPYWNNYDYGWDYGWGFDYGYYAKAAPGFDGEQTTTTTQPEPPVRHFGKVDN